MKKNTFLFLAITALAFLITSCSKDDTTTPTNSTPEGTWVGTGQYSTMFGGPTYPFTLTFKANGSIDIVGNNSTAVDNATGTWQLVQDSVKATYTYVSSSAVYTFSGKFTAGATVMAGTIGLSPSTSGVGLFSVTRQ
jgi:hypothetical protein